MILPNADKAVIPIEKLRDYCLNPLHKFGKHKARVFESALGLTMKDAGYLKDILLDKVKTQDTIHINTNEFGDHYFIDFELTVGEKKALLRSKWIIGHGVNYPRLTSCYVKRK